MSQQRVWCLQNAPDPGLLVSMKLNRPARTGQGQMIAIERADARVIERVVVKSAEPFPPRIIRPHPFFELFFDAFLFFTRSLRGLRVDDGLFIHRVIDSWRLEIQGVLDEFKCRVTIRAPVRRIGGCAACVPIRIDAPDVTRLFWTA